MKRPSQKVQIPKQDPAEAIRLKIVDAEALRDESIKEIDAQANAILSPIFARIHALKEAYQILTGQEYNPPAPPVTGSPAQPAETGPLAPVAGKDGESG